MEQRRLTGGVMACACARWAGEIGFLCVAVDVTLRCDLTVGGGCCDSIMRHYYYPLASHFYFSDPISWSAA